MTLEERLHAMIESAPPHIQRHFACDCAERALRRAKVKDKRLWKAVEVARRYAEGRAGLSELADAKDAAWDASAASAAGAARASAWVDASAAARASAGAAARASAGAAARASAGAAARAAAWADARDAARAAAGAARDEEREWQLTHLQCLLAAHDDARSSLLGVLSEHAARVQVSPSFAQTLEEALFT